MEKTEQNTKVSRRELMAEAKLLHDQLLGKEHCERGKLYSCVALQQCIPQAANNVRARKKTG